MQSAKIFIEDRQRFFPFIVTAIVFAGMKKCFPNLPDLSRIAFAAVPRDVYKRYAVFLPREGVFLKLRLLFSFRHAILAEIVC